MRGQKKSTFCILIFACAVLCAEPVPPNTPELDYSAPNYSDLLQGYITHDMQMERLMIAVERSRLELEEARIVAGFDISLSSGDISMNFLDGKTELSASPQASISIPLLNNTKIRGNLPISAALSGDSADDVSLSGGTLSVSTSILSGIPETQRIAILTAERKLHTAERNYQYRFMGAEKEFLQKLKNLYTLDADFFKANEDLIIAENDFQLVQFQGYRETSANYRTALLKVRGLRHTREERFRTLQRELAYFAEQCGYTDSSISLDDLPMSMPESELLVITDFSEDTFIALEDSRWTHELNGLTRQADKDLTLDGSLGYRFRESSSDEQFHYIEPGLSMSYRGISAGAKVSVPVNDPGSPSLSFSLGWALNTGRRDKIADSKKLLNIREEQLAITSAEDSYSTTVSDYELKRRDLLWEQTEQQEMCDLHTELARDMEQWYQQGTATEKDYRAARLNMHSAVISVVKSHIDRLTYNIDMQLLFSEAAE